MNYTSADSTNKLASRKWRIRHSAWLLAPILGLGMFSFVGFLYVALRVRSRKFWIAGAVGCIGSTLAWISSGLALAAWVGLIIYGIILNRDYLLWRATRTEANAWYKQPAPQSTTNTQLAPAPTIQHPWQPKQQTPAPGIAAVDFNRFYAPNHSPQTFPHPSQPMPQVSAPGPAGTGQYPASNNPAPAPAPTASVPMTKTPPLDVNLASALDLTATLHIDPVVAGRVVAIRDARGAYRDLNDLATTAGLQPHELIRFRGKLSFGQAQPVANAPAIENPTMNIEQPGRRILDY